MKKYNKKSRLIEAGVFLYAPVIKASLAQGKNRGPLLTLSHTFPTGETIEFHCEGLWNKGTQYYRGQYLRVYINPTNYSDYYVDVDNV